MCIRDRLVALYRGDAAAQGGTSSAAAETETAAQAASDAERQPAALRTVYTLSLIHIYLPRQMNLYSH